MNEAPEANRADIDPRKLVEYCSSTDHPVGEHKAAVSHAALGLTPADADLLRRESLRAAIDGEADSERSDEFGDRFSLDFEMITPTGRTIGPVGLDRPDGRGLPTPDDLLRPCEVTRIWRRKSRSWIR